MTSLRTDRLLLRSLVPADAEAYAAMGYHPLVTEWLPDTLDLPLVFAIPKPDNIRAQAVMKRIGLRDRKVVTYQGIDAGWFDIARESRCQVAA